MRLAARALVCAAAGWAVARTAGPWILRLRVCPSHQLCPLRDAAGRTAFCVPGAPCFYSPFLGEGPRADGHIGALRFDRPSTLVLRLRDADVDPASCRPPRARACTVLADGIHCHGHSDFQTLAEAVPSLDCGVRLLTGDAVFNATVDPAGALYRRRAAAQEALQAQLGSCNWTAAATRWARTPAADGAALLSPRFDRGDAPLSALASRVLGARVNLTFLADPAFEVAPCPAYATGPAPHDEL